ncbi:MAG: hypothetical protein EOO65_04625 [Methanosarcinales archaeon]|nr:MAG: hypothetical protein EOO65_04625 [Methanosarcinales archaeon]
MRDVPHEIHVCKDEETMSLQLGTLPGGPYPGVRDILAASGKATLPEAFTWLPTLEKPLFRVRIAADAEEDSVSVLRRFMTHTLTDDDADMSGAQPSHDQLPSPSRPTVPAPPLPASVDAMIPVPDERVRLRLRMPHTESRMADEGPVTMFLRPPAPGDEAPPSVAGVLGKSRIVTVELHDDSMEMWVENVNFEAQLFASVVTKQSSRDAIIQHRERQRQAPRVLDTLTCHPVLEMTACGVRLCAKAAMREKWKR